VSTVITGASRAEQVTENMRAVDAADKITPDVMATIDEVLGNKPAALEAFGRD
jgi:aryl-alcohol dehydrogenase-like predicted oxidoreductase